MAIDYNLLKSYIGDDPLYNLYEQGWQGLLDPGNIKSFQEDPLVEKGYFDKQGNLANLESSLLGYTRPVMGDTSLYIGRLDEFGNKPSGPLYGKSIMDESFLDSESWKEIQSKPGGETRYITKRENITNALNNPESGFHKEHALSGIFGFYNSPKDVAEMPHIYETAGYQGGSQPTITERNKQIAETIGHEARHQLLMTPEFTEKYVNTLPSGEFDFYGQKRDFPGYYDKHESLNRMLDFQAYNDPNIYSSIYGEMDMPRNLTNMYTDALSENATKFTNDILDQEAAQLRRFLHYNYPESAAWKSYKNNDRKNINIAKIPHQDRDGITSIARPKRTYVSPARPHGDDRGSMPTGTAGRNPWGRADGGLATMFERRR